MLREKARGVTIQECSVLFWKNAGSMTPKNGSCMATFLPSHKISKLDEKDMLGTAGKERSNS